MLHFLIITFIGAMLIGLLKTTTEILLTLPVPVSPLFWVGSFTALGAILGSYVNMAAYRLPRNISTVTKSRSFCPKCNHQLNWYDNIPVLSFLSLFGKCRYCRAPIPPRYLFTELIIAGLFAAASYQLFALNGLVLSARPFTGPLPPALFAIQLFLIVDLVLLSVVDLETWLIPGETTFPWMMVGLVLAPIFPEIHGAATQWTSNHALNAFLDSFQGLVIGAGLPWAVGFMTTFLSFFYYRINGIKSRPLEGMGSGDAHLLGMFGAMLGWKAALLTMIMGIFIGCFVGISKILWDKIQQRRLGDKWKPWQPVFDLPEDPALAQQKPVFYPLLVMGVVVMLVVMWLSDQSTRSFNQRLFATPEEVERGVALTAPMRLGDPRMAAVWLMGLLALLLLIAFPFCKYLASIDMLPQGDIAENEKGEKQETMQGNYIPFGPSLALAALIVVFWGPLLRNFIYWWFVQEGKGPIASMPYRMILQDQILAPIMAAVQWFLSFGERMTGG